MSKKFYKRLKSTFIAGMASSLILAFLGPFGTYTELSLLNRIVYWGTLCNGIGLLTMLTLSYLCPRLPTGMLGLGYVVLGSGLAAIPGTALIIFMYSVMRAEPVDPSWTRILDIWFKATVISTCITLIEMVRSGFLLIGKTNPTAVTEVSATKKDDSLETQPQPTSDLHALLDANLSASALISMTMQDHYVKVTTEAGSELLLMRFSDALESVGDLEGLRIHRSHWVAQSHIVEFWKSGHKAKVILTDGRDLPVSRTYVADVQRYMARRATASAA